VFKYLISNPVITIESVVSSCPYITVFILYNIKNCTLRQTFFNRYLFKLNFVFLCV